MSLDLQALDQSSREELIAQARLLGVERPEVMTRMELKDEIVRRSETDAVQRQRARGWLGVARDLVAGVVESGLNLPDAAKLIRGGAGQDVDWKGPPPVATVTLAEIYAHQGHIDRALAILDEVLAKEADHEPARALRERLQQERSAAGGRRRKLAEVEVETDSAPQEREEVTRPEAAPAPSTDVPAPDFLPPEAASAEEASSSRAEPTPSFAHAVVEEAIAEPVREFLTLPEAVAPNTVPEAGAATDADFGPVPLAEAGAEPEELAAVSHEPELLSEQEPETTLNFEPRTKLSPEVSAAIAIRDHGRTYVYWEICSKELDALRTNVHEGRLVARIAQYRPSSEGPRRNEQVIVTEELVGGTWIPESSAQDSIRVAVGLDIHDRFYPLAIATVLAFEGDQHTLSVHFRARFTAAVPEAEERALSHYRSHLAA